VGLTRKQAEALGLGALFPPAGGNGGRGRRARIVPPDRRGGGPPPDVVEFWVAGRPYGWKHHEGYGQHATKQEDLKAWQVLVGLSACRAMAGAAPILDQVRFTADFFLAHRAGRPPDRTNLLKAAEDACQGIVFANDTQVTGGDACRWIAPAAGILSDIEGARIVVERLTETGK
jgi:Holliday junction resolvase RusA-like endonuclease